MDFRDIQFNIHHFERLASTNIHAHEMLRKGLIDGNAVIRADYQTEGKGQRGRVWQSQSADNMLISIVIKAELSVQKAYYLNKLIAIAVYDLLDNLSVEKLTIKWPNDILVDGKKICGILIENSIQGQMINQSIIGIGLNVNQKAFPSFDRKPTSLKIEVNTSFEIEELLNKLLAILKSRLMLLNDQTADIDELYHDRLYGKDQELNYLIDSKHLKATIQKVDQNGQLHLMVDGVDMVFSERELKFID